MERPIHLLFAASRDRYSDLLRRLQVRYAVHQARDDAALVECADQARAAGHPYTLASGPSAQVYSGSAIAPLGSLAVTPSCGGRPCLACYLPGVRAPASLARPRWSY
jgi:hypothetical protein